MRRVNKDETQYDLKGMPFNSEFIRNGYDYIQAMRLSENYSGKNGITHLSKDKKFLEEWKFCLSLGSHPVGIPIHYLEHAYPEVYHSALGIEHCKTNPERCEWDLWQSLTVTDSALRKIRRH